LGLAVGGAARAWLAARATIAALAVTRTVFMELSLMT
jgi:hypothetical protein